jgi:hypothetical protein
MHRIFQGVSLDELSRRLQHRNNDSASPLADASSWFITAGMKQVIDTNDASDGQVRH